MILKDDVLLFACGSALPHKTHDFKPEWHNTITAIDTENGKVIWRAPHRQDGIFVTPDLFVAGRLVWHAPIDSGHSSGNYIALDLKTGKVVHDIETKKRPQMPHHRCYRNRATQRLIFTGWNVVNIFDTQTSTWDHN